jgi:hypothetical protein
MSEHCSLFLGFPMSTSTVKLSDVSLRPGDKKPGLPKEAEIGKAQAEGPPPLIA